MKTTILLSFLIYSQLFAGETKWLSIGSLHNWYSNTGSEIEIGRRNFVPDQQDGLRWPAQYRWQDSQASKALWIGTQNYTDAIQYGGETYQFKVVHVGPRVSGENEFMPVEFKLVGKKDKPIVRVDGNTASSLQYLDVVDEIDETLDADRMLYNVVNTSIGITMVRKIYAFSQQNHDNYIISEYIFKNTGNVDVDDEIEQNVILEDVYFSFINRYAPTKEIGPYGSAFAPQSTAWGQSTMLDTRGEDPNSADPFRGVFSWLGRHSGESVNLIGGPNAGGNGLLAAAQFMGTVVLHADISNNNKSDDPYQPMTTQYIGSDLNITSQNSQFDPIKMTAEYAAMTAGHAEVRHADAVGDGYADLFGGTGGGYSHFQGFGPYTLQPGDSIRIVLAEAVAGLNRHKAYDIGDNWLNGSAPFDLPDESTTNNADEYKNAWVFTGRDSLFQTFNKAIANYENNFNIPVPPSPPDTFEVVSLNDHIELSWSDNAENNPNFGGYSIYRAVGRNDTIYQHIYSCGLNTGNPQLVNYYEDSSIIPQKDYYYYIRTFDDGSTNNGVPLFSSLFWTRTDQPASVPLELKIDADLYVNPAGSDENSGLTAEDPFRTITFAIENIFSTQFHRHNIFLSEGVYSPQTNGEQFPLPLSYSSLKGLGEKLTILNAQGEDVISSHARDIFIEDLTIMNGRRGINVAGQGLLTLNNVIIENNSGEGIYINNGNLKLSNVTIRENGSRGIYAPETGSLQFDVENRSNIFSNGNGQIGADIFFNFPNPIDVFVDTFSVISPSDYYAYPEGKFKFNILNYKTEQIDADLYVSPIGNDDNDGLSPESPFQTIEQAIKRIKADSLNQHTIYLNQGIYSPQNNNERFPVYCRSNVTLSGVDRENTELDANESNYVLNIFSDTNVVIKDIAIKNGTSYNGAGIYCVNSDPSLQNLLIFDNNLGAGIRCINSNPTISNTKIFNNSANNFGGGIYCTDSDPFLESVEISNNTAHSGGGIFLDNSVPTLKEVIIKKNRAALGGGIYFDYNANANFDTLNRSSIFLNSDSLDIIGRDLYFYANSQDSIITVALDTFTVLMPEEKNVFPLENFRFDINNFKVRQVYSDIYVSPTGDNQNSGLLQSEPLQTITYALDLIHADSSNRITIFLENGHYSPSQSGEQFPLKGKNFVSIKGQSEDLTILDAEMTSGVFEFENISMAQISDLSIINGLAQQGAGVFCNRSDLEIRNVTFEGDSVAVNGGAISGLYSNIKLSDVSFTKNRSNRSGAALYLDSSICVIRNCLFAENISQYRGGAIFITGSNLLIDKTIINNNFARSYGGAITSQNAFLDIKNATIYNNSSNSNAAGLAFIDGSIGIIINSILWFNNQYGILLSSSGDPSEVSIAFSDLENGEDGIRFFEGTVNLLEGNINAPPLFIGGDPFDFNLTENSPAVDAGTAFYVLDNDTVANISNFSGNAPDMGAIESDFVSAITGENIIPTEFSLYKNFPNPFNPETTIRYDLPVRTNVKITIYNILGQRIRLLINEIKNPGQNFIKWDGKDSKGKQVATGVYIYQMEAGDYSSAKKMILVQ